MNKAMMGILLIALLGGGVVGGAMTGMIDIPGLSPAKKSGGEALYEGDKTPEDQAAASTDGQKPGDAQAGSKDVGTAPKATATAADAPKKDAKAADTKPAADSAKAQASKPQPAASTAAPRTAKPAKDKVQPKFDAELGRKKAAKLWDEMSVEALTAMIASRIKDRKYGDLPAILALMDNAKVAKVLEKLQPDQAADLTKKIQTEASKVKPPG